MTPAVKRFGSIVDRRPSLALLEDLPPEQLAILQSGLPAGSIVLQGGSDPEVVSDAEYLLVRDASADRSILASAPRLHTVLRLGGLGGVDEAACNEMGIRIHTIRSGLATVAEHTVMLILMLFKRFKEANDRLRAGSVAGSIAPSITTQDSYAYNWVGLERFEALRGKRVGLVGLGEIGQQTATLLRCFGTAVYYTKRNRLQESDEDVLGVHFAPLDEVLRTSDCVSLHARFHADTERLMGEREFSLMKAGSYFVNTARGRLVDEASLLRALESGHLAGAALDVYWYEPLPLDSPLLYADNLLLTPHTAGIPIRESQALELEEAAVFVSQDSQ